MNFRRMLQMVEKKELMDKMLLVLSISYFIILVAAITIEQFQYLQVILVLAILIISGIQYLQVIRKKSDTIKTSVLSLIEYAFLVMAFYQAQSDIENVLLILFTVKIVLMHRVSFSLPFSILGYATYLYIYGEMPETILAAGFTIFSFGIFVAMVMSFKIILRQKNTIDSLNRKMIEQSSAMEEMAQLRERNRIAEEVHNSIGHTLTTAIVALEGADLLFERKPDKAHEKLIIAKKQLKDGLGNVREVVRAMRSDPSAKRDITLQEMINELIENVQAQTGVKVQFMYQISSKILSLQNFVLYNAVQESITNALKHGQATNINIDIRESDGIVYTEIFNNGISNSSVLEGFGLTSMKSNVYAIGGNFDYLSDENGFVIKLQIPLVGGRQDDAN